jgi:hypothetical protein
MAGLYRRGKVYWARAQRKGHEHRRSLQTSNRAVAEKRFRQWLGDLEAVQWGDKPRRSWQEAQDRFIREHLTTIKPMAAKRYGVSLKNLAEDMGGLTLDQIGSAALSAFETRRRADGVQPGTIRRDLACLSSLMTSAVDWEWIDSNPVPSYLRRRAKRGLKEAPGRVRYAPRKRNARGPRGGDGGNRYGTAKGGAVQPAMEPGRPGARRHNDDHPDQERPSP